MHKHILKKGEEPSNGYSFVRNREKNHRKKKTLNTNLGNKRPARSWLWPWLAITAQGWRIHEQSHLWEELKQGRCCNSLLLSKRGELQGLFTHLLSTRRVCRSILLPMETNLGSGARQHCQSRGSAYIQLHRLNESKNRWIFYHFSPWIFGGFFISAEREDANSQHWHGEASS